MAGSRLERIGTIFSRTTGLLQSKAVSLEDRPVWYDVYKHFPPTLPPRYDRSAPSEPIRNIFYPEDVIRAKFHQRVGKKLPAIDLSDNANPSVTQRLIELCNKFQKEKQMELDDAFESAFDVLKAEGTIFVDVGLRRRQQQSSRSGYAEDSSLASSFKRATSDNVETAPSAQVNIKDIFKEEDSK